MPSLNPSFRVFEFLRFRVREILMSYVRHFSTKFQQDYARYETGRLKNLNYSSMSINSCLFYPLNQLLQLQQPPRSLQDSVHPLLYSYHLSSSNLEPVLPRENKLHRRRFASQIWALQDNPNAAIGTADSEYEKSFIIKSSTLTEDRSIHGGGGVSSPYASLSQAGLNLL